MVASLVFTVAALMIYLLSKPFKNVAGRCEFMLLVGIFLFNVSYPILHNYSKDSTVSIVAAFVFFISLLMMFLWTSVLIFDVCLNFKTQGICDNFSERFGSYCWLTVGPIFLSMLVIILTVTKAHDLKNFAKILSRFLEILFLGMIIADVVLLLWTGFIIFKVSKTLRSTGYAWFMAEKNRQELNNLKFER